MTGSYKQFCPVAMAAEILGTRWTLVLLRELVAGATRFNELRRGVPRMSPALLSKRLKDLEAARIVTRRRVESDPDLFEYRLTEAGMELRPVIEAVGAWGHRWIETEASLKNLDPTLLMWDMRRNVGPFPAPGAGTLFRSFLPIQGAAAELVVDRRARSGTRFMFGRSWLRHRPVPVGRSEDDDRNMDGLRRIGRAKDQGTLMLTGNKELEAHLGTWLRLSVFAKVERMVA